MSPHWRVVHRLEDHVFQLELGLLQLADTMPLADLVSEPPARGTSLLLTGIHEVEQACAPVIPRVGRNRLASTPFKPMVRAAA